MALVWFLFLWQKFRQGNGEKRFTLAHICYSIVITIDSIWSNYFLHDLTLVGASCIGLPFFYTCLDDFWEWHLIFSIVCRSHFGWSCGGSQSNPWLLSPKCYLQVWFLVLCYLITQYTWMKYNMGNIFCFQQVSHCLLPLVSFCMVGGMSNLLMNTLSPHIHFKFLWFFHSFMILCF